MGDAIKAYISKNPRASATINFHGTVIGVKPAPVVASFSGRGPNGLNPEILKPDLIAPGVNILAAWTDAVGPTGLDLDNRKAEFNILSGTSMACPHVSGAAALLKSTHPDWSPAAIRSAMMTTASLVDNRLQPMTDEATGKPATPYDYGAGHLNLDLALDPGVVYDLANQDYVSFLCAIEYGPKTIQVITKSPVNRPMRKPLLENLNYPLIAALFSTASKGVSSKTFFRTVTNVGDANAFSWNHPLTMQNFCLLEVDVNGQEIFLVDKAILESFSGRLRKLFSKLTGKTRRLKLIFDKFPGGAECFELIVKFCYNGDSIKITPFNMFQLHCAANYLEMNGEMQGKPNLLEQTVSFFRKIHYMTWSELIIGLEKCQDLLFFLPSSSLLQDFLDCVVGRLELHYICSPSASSTDNSSIQFSGDISTKSRGICTSQATWWFADLGFLKLNMFKKIIETMISKKLDHQVISSFLFYYKRLKCPNASLAQKCRIIETVIKYLYSLDGSFMSIRVLFDILQASFTLKMSKCSVQKLEHLIGSQLDRAKLDDLLVPSPAGEKIAYNVKLILRLLDIFLSSNREKLLMYQLKKVAELIDLYIMEVAPDPCLKPSMFLALAMAMPDIARESYDTVYLAMDMYLKVHYGPSEEEKIKICSVLNYDKLSEETLKELAQNESFPACALTMAQVTLQNKLRYSVTRTSNFS